MTEKNDVKREGGKDSIALIETNEHIADSSVSFLTSEGEEARIKLALERGVFIGFTKEELLKFEQDPGWKRLRIVLLCIFWAAWVVLLVATILAIVKTPTCPSRPKSEWAENFPIYEIYVPSFRIGKETCNSTSGNIEGVIDVISDGSSYFDRIKPANTYWLRGIDLSGENEEKLERLFEIAKKKQRRIILDLMPFSLEDGSSDPSQLNCTIFAGSSVKAAGLQESKIRCFSNEKDIEGLVDTVSTFRRVANGFILDYNKWFVNTTEGKESLAEIVEAVSMGSSGDSTTGDNAKHLFMRFPILDDRFTDPNKRQELMSQRILEETAAREAGVRVVIDTIAMNNVAGGCTSVDCLKNLVNAIEAGRNEGEDSWKRAFAIDDPMFGSRTSPGELKSNEALAAFAIAALPGVPILYYGSEIGMHSAESSTDIMQWTDANENSCPELSSLLCYCNMMCISEGVAKNRTSGCPSGSSTQYHDASVREQIREESAGSFKTVVQLLNARQTNDSLRWGSSSISVEQTHPKSQKILYSVRQGGEFDKFALFLSLGSDSEDDQAIPPLPPSLKDSCFQTVYSYSDGKISDNPAKQQFSEMILQENEVRLVRVYATCRACSFYLGIWTLLTAIICSLCLRN